MKDKLNRFLSLMLALIMVLSIVPVSAEDSIVVVDETNTTTDAVSETDPVAQIGETPYTSLEAAFAAAETGATITLLDDVDEVVQLSVSDTEVKRIVLDLNDKTWDCGYGTRINAVDLTIKNGTIGTRRWGLNPGDIVDVFHFGGHSALPSTMRLTGVTFNAELHVNNMAPSDEELELLKSVVKSTDKAPNATTVIIEDGQFDVVTVQSKAYLTLNGGFFSGINVQEGAYFTDNRKTENNNTGTVKENGETTNEIKVAKDVTIQTLPAYNYARTETGLTVTFVDSTPFDETAEENFMEFTANANSTTFIVQVLDGENWVDVDPKSGTSTVKHVFTEPGTATYRCDWDKNGTYDRLVVLVKAPVAKVGDKYYTNIDEALANWKDGTTLTLLANVTVNLGAALTTLSDEEMALEGKNITAADGESAISIESGNVTLIVNADTTLTGGKGGAGIYVAEGASVTIKGTGTLTAIGNGGVDSSDSGAAGIGGTYANGNSGAIIIDGATVVAKGYGVHGSGIGSGSGKVVGEIKIINGANVTAYGGYYADGAGTTLQSSYGKSDPEGGAAIGGGGKTASTIADITITNSTVVAYGGSKAAGIGANFWSNCGTITISGNSDVTAQGGSSSAGIGTSRAGDAGVTANIVISGGTVTATGGAYGAGIGGGYNADSLGNGADASALPEISVTISGGTITATGGEGGAGIGGGYKTDNIDIDITGGTVTAKAGALVSGKTIDNGGEACAIGSGANGSGVFENSPAVEIADAATVTAITKNGGKVAIEGNIDESWDALENVTVIVGPVAKVGDTEYDTIDEAIAAWTNGTTLTLLADVTLSDVIQLSSTEKHTLDLGTYTMTAAKSKDAIQIVNNARSSADYALDIKADGTNPGGITATGKAIVRTSGKSGVKDRPIIRFYNGIFNASNIVYHSGSNGTNCPQFQFYNGVYNGTISTNRTLNQFYGGTFNGVLSMSVDTSAYTLISGGAFKYLSNSKMSELVKDKFTIGSAKGVYDKGIYVDENGYFVVGGDPITNDDVGTFALSTTYHSQLKPHESWIQPGGYLYCSSAQYYGLFYKEGYDYDNLVQVIKDTAKQNDKDHTINLYQDFPDLTKEDEIPVNNNLTLNLNIYSIGEPTFVLARENTLTAPKGLTVIPAEEGFTVDYEEEYGYYVVREANFVAQVGETKYETLTEAVAAANAYVDAEGVAAPATVTLLADVELGEKLAISNNVTIEGAYTITRADDYTGTLFAVDAGATLTLDGGLTIDGGNAWTYTKMPLEMDMENGAGTYVANHITPAEDGVNVTANVIENKGTLNVNSVTIQNSYSTNNVHLINAGANSETIINGATIKNVAANASGAVAYIGGADAVLTIKGETKITGNFGIGNGGIIQNYGQGTTVNLEGGSIDHNHVGKSGTVYASYSGNASKINTFNMTGGSITNNIMEGYGPVYIHTNTVWNMTGGEISNNSSYLPNYVRNANPAGTMAGGKIVDNKSYGTDYDVYYVTHQDLRLNGKTGITGGTYSQDVFEYLAPNYGLAYDESTGYYTVTTDIAEVNGTIYCSIAEAVEAANAEDTIKVLASHKIDKTIVLEKNVTIDLNGKTILNTSTEENVYLDIFKVLANVTITGSGKVDARNGKGYAAYVGNHEGTVGNLTVNGGTFYGDVSAIQVTKGVLTVNDGNYAVKADDGNYNFVLNCIDANYKDGSAKIYVQGGTFYMYDPANNAAEGANTNFVVEGYISEANADETIWTVRKANYIAQVGETKYEDLKEAIDACTNGETVKLIADITYDADDVVSGMGGATGFANYPQDCIVYIGGTQGATEAENKPSNVNAAIDLNGHSITNNANAYLFLIMDNAKITFTGEGSITTTADLPAVWCCGTDTLVKIEGGSYSTTSSNGLLHATHAGDIVIDGGRFWTTADDASALLVIHSGKFNNPPYFLVGEATMTVNGGEFRGFNPEYTPDAKTDPVSYVNAVADGMVAVNFSRDGETWWTPELIKAKIDYMKLGMFADEIIYPSDVADSLQGLVDYFMVCNAANENFGTGDYKPVLTINVDLDEKVVIGGASSDGRQVSAEPMTWTIELKGEFDPENIEPAQGYVKTKVDDDTYTVTFDYVEWVKAELLAGRSVTLDRDIVVDGSYIDSIPADTNNNGDYWNPGIFNVVGKSVTFNLNGHSITYNGHANANYVTTSEKKIVNSCTVAHGLFFANDGAYLNVCGDGVITVYGMASGIYAASPNSVINVTGGTWKNERCETCGGTNMFLYASHGGELHIEGGYFDQALDSNGDSYLIVEHGGSPKNEVVDYSKTKVIVTGGTFKGMNPEEAVYLNQITWNSYTLGETNVVAEGYIAREIAENTWQVGMGEYVAQIGDVKYETLQAAIDAAQDGDTIVVLENIDLAENELQKLDGYDTYFLVEGKSVTINLNGKTISGEYTGSLLVGVFSTDKNGHLTLTGNGTVDVTATGTVYTLITAYNDGSTVTIENGTYKLDKAYDSLIFYGGYTDAAVTVKGGTYTLDNVGTGENGKPWIFNVVGAGDHHVRITGGTFNADINRQHWSNEAVVDKTCYVVNNNGTWTVKDGAVAYVNTGMTTGPYYAPKDVGYATIEEAFTAAVSADDKSITLLQNVALTEDVAISIKVLELVANGFALDCNGHEIKLTKAEATLTAAEGLSVISGVEGYKAVYENGVYKLVEAEPVAQIGEGEGAKLYTTLQAAINDAKDGETIVVLTDIDLAENELQSLDGYDTYFLVEGKSVTINLNGKIISGEYTGNLLVGVFSTNKNGHLTLTNGTVTATGAVYTLITAFNDGSTVTIENGTYKLDKASDSLIFYGGYTDAAVTVKGGTFTVGNLNDANGPWIFNVLGAGDHYVLITGGTFNADINRQKWSNEAMVAETHYVVNNGDGTWTVEAGAVAYVATGMVTGPYFYRKNVGYATIEEAFEAAVTYDDVNITLLQNVALTKDVEISIAGIVLNANGKTLDCAGYAIKLTEAEATLTAAEGLNVTTNVEGMKVVYEEGVYKLVEAEPVAQITDAEGVTTQYTSIQAAINAAQDGDTIVVIEDIDVAEYEPVKWNGYNVYALVEGKTVTIDLNGKTISGKYTDNTWLYGVFVTNNNGHLTLKGNGTVDITDGTTAANGRIFTLIANFTSDSSITIENGTYKVDRVYQSMIMDAGEVNGAIHVKGGIFTLDNLDDENGPWIINVAGAGDHYVLITGGTFNANINRQKWSIEAMVAETHYVVDNGNGTWTVMPDAVAYVYTGMLSGGFFTPKNVGYATIEEAFAAAVAYEDVNITLLQDVALTKDVEISIAGIVLNDNDFVLDCAGYAIKLTAEAATLTADAGLNVTTNVEGMKVVYEEGVYKLVEAVPVAAIGETTYTTLQAAIDAAVAGDEIIFLADITEDVTVDKSVTIDGKSYKYTGNIAVEGGTVSATIKNINFVDGTSYAVTTNRIKSITIEDCTVSNYGYGFLYANKSTPTVTVKNVVVNGGNYGVHWAYGTSATLENVTMTNVTNGLFIQNYANKSMTVKNSTISSIAIYERSGSSGVQTFNFEGTNTVGTLTDSAYAKYVLVDVDSTLAAPVDFEVTTNLEGYVVEYDPENLLYKVVKVNYVAQIGETKYTSIQEAVEAAQEGDTILVIDDIELSDEVLTIDKAVKITIDLNGHTITGTVTKTTTALVYITGGCDLTLKDGTETNGGIHAVNTNGNLSNLIRVETDGKLVIENGNYTQDASVNGAGMIDSRGDEIITVKGGNFHLGNIGTASNGSPWIFNASSQNTKNIIVTGGTYNADIVHQYYPFEVMMSETLAMRNNGDGTWTVVDAVAYVNEQEWSSAWYTNNVGYATLAEAIGAVEAKEAKDGKTPAEEYVTLLTDIELTEAIELTKSIKIDVADKKLTGEALVLTAADITLTAAEGLNVTTNLDGHAVVYEDGVYKVVEVMIQLKAIEVSAEAAQVLRLKFTINDGFFEIPGAYAVLTEEGNSRVDEQVVTYTVEQIKDMIPDANGRYVFEQGIAAAEMTGNVTITFYDGEGSKLYVGDYSDGVIKTDITRTVVDYAKLALERSTDATQRAVVATMVTYGGYAQKWFDVDVDNLASNILTEQLDLGAANVDAIRDMTITNADNLGVQAVTQQADLQSYVYLRTYFKFADDVDVSGYTFTVTKPDGTMVVVTPVLRNDGRYYIDVYSPVARWDNDYTITVANAEGESCVVTGSILAYVKRGINSGKATAEQVDVFKAMILYNAAANEFFGR